MLGNGHLRIHFQTQVHHGGQAAHLVGGDGKSYAGLNLQKQVYHDGPGYLDTVPGPGNGLFGKHKNIEHDLKHDIYRNIRLEYDRQTSHAHNLCAEVSGLIFILSRSNYTILYNYRCIYIQSYFSSVWILYANV